MYGPNFDTNENSQKTFGRELKTTIWGSKSPIQTGMPGQKELCICQVSCSISLNSLDEPIFIY